MVGGMVGGRRREMRSAWIDPDSPPPVGRVVVFADADRSPVALVGLGWQDDGWHVDTRRVLPSLPSLPSGPEGGWKNPALAETVWRPTLDEWNQIATGGVTVIDPPAGPTLETRAAGRALIANGVCGDADRCRWACVCLAQGTRNVDAVCWEAADAGCDATDCNRWEHACAV
jgi:hypothetical protein